MPGRKITTAWALALCPGALAALAAFAAAGGCGSGISDRFPDAAANRIYVAGDFTNWDNEPGYGIVRLRPDGARDTGFESPIAIGGGRIYAMAEAPDGSGIFVGGDFTSIQDAQGLVTVSNLAKLRHDGTVDRGFLGSGEGPTALVSTLAVHDGYLYVGGDFSSYTDGAGNPNTIGKLMRIDPETSLIDSGFIGNGQGLDSGQVNAIAFHGNHVYVGTTAANAVYTHGATGDGSVEYGMRIDVANGDFSIDMTANQSIEALLVLGDQLLLGGLFTTCFGVAGQTNTCMLDLPGLTIDGDWNAGAGTGGSMIRALLSTPDGVVVAGPFSQLMGDTAQDFMGRLDATTGALDTGFGAGLIGAVGSTIEALVYFDGAVWAGGQIAGWNDASGTLVAAVGGVMKLTATGEADPEFTLNAGVGAGGGSATVEALLPVTL